MTSITIPSSVASIGDFVFYGCSSLSVITTGIVDVFKTGTCTFEGCGKVTLCVPAGTDYEYSTKADWNRIHHMKESSVDGFHMKLACDYMGSVLVNDKTVLTNTIKDIKVNENEKNTFEFTPNDDCRLVQVILNGLDVTSSVNNNKLTAMIPAKSQMVVVFCKSSDINRDGKVDISDVVALVNNILRQSDGNNGGGNNGGDDNGEIGSDFIELTFDGTTKHKDLLDIYTELELDEDDLIMTSTTEDLFSDDGFLIFLSLAHPDSENRLLSSSLGNYTLANIDKMFESPENLMLGITYKKNGNYYDVMNGTHKVTSIKKTANGVQVSGTFDATLNGNNKTIHINGKYAMTVL